MKTIKITFVFVLFLSSLFLNAQIKVTSNGEVGIGTLNPSTSTNVTIEGDYILLRSKSNNEHSFLFENNSYQEIVDLSPSWHEPYDGYLNTWQYNLGGEFPFDWIFSFNGWFSTLTTSTFYNYSDKLLKKDINQLGFSKGQFSLLNPVTYNMVDSIQVNKRNGGKQILKFEKKDYPINGFIAQDVQKVYPGLVEKDSETGLLKIKPLELIPILVKAIQSQQQEIDVLKTEIATLSSSSAKAKSNNAINSITETPILYQNTPNPFSQSTQILYSLPESVSTASIYIYDMNGTQLKCYPISKRQEGSIIIQGSELNAGMYLYTLIADGKVIDTKRMILTKQ